MPALPGDVSDTTPLRARYLTRLLETWISASQLEVFAGNGIAVRSDPTGAGLVFFEPDPSVETTLCTSDGHHCVLLDLGKCDQGGELARALNDGDLGLEAKARILQMIMQCKLPSFEIADARTKETNSVQGLVTALKGIRRRAQKCTFEERIALVLLARKYQAFLVEAQAYMARERKIRTRQFKNKEALEPKKRKLATTVALEHLTKQQRLVDAGELKAFVQEGNSLLYIGSVLGFSSIATFPGTVVRPHEFVLSFATAKSCFKTLSRPIDPTE